MKFQVNLINLLKELELLIKEIKNITKKDIIKLNNTNIQLYNGVKIPNGNICYASPRYQ